MDWFYNSFLQWLNSDQSGRILVILFFIKFLCQILVDYFHPFKAILLNTDNGNVKSLTTFPTVFKIVIIFETY